MTAKRLPISSLPGWPRFLTLDMAAAWAGASPSHFLDEVAQGIWPQPWRRGKQGGLVTWDIKQLEAARDAAPLTPPPPPPEMPREDDEKFRERIRNGKAKVTRTQKGSQAA